MFKALTPIFALIIAFGLGFTYVKPEFEAIRSLQEEERQYTEAIATVSELRDNIQSKISQIDSYNPIDLERLSVMLPNDIVEVSVIMSLDAVTRKHRMVLENILVKGGDAGEQPNPDGTPAEKPAVSSLDISFTVLGTYDDFRSLMEELERSLVFYDVVDLGISQAEGDLTAYSLTIRTYAYNPLP